MGSGASAGSFTVDFASQVATSVCNSFLSSGKCSKDEAEVRSVHIPACRPVSMLSHVWLGVGCGWNCSPFVS